MSIINHAGSLSAFAHSQPDTPKTTEALYSVCATCPTPKPTDATPNSPIRNHPGHPPNQTIRKCSADYSPAFASLSRPSAKQANRTTAPACRFIRFTSLRFHSVPSVSAVLRTEISSGAALRFVCAAQR